MRASSAASFSCARARSLRCTSKSSRATTSKRSKNVTSSACRFFSKSCAGDARMVSPRRDPSSSSRSLSMRFSLAHVSRLDRDARQQVEELRAFRGRQSRADASFVDRDRALRAREPRAPGAGEPQAVGATVGAFAALDQAFHLELIEHADHGRAIAVHGVREAAWRDSGMRLDEEQHPHALWRESWHARSEIAEYALLREAQTITDQPGQEPLIQPVGRRSAAPFHIRFAFKQLAVPRTAACYAALMNLAEHLLGPAALARHGSRIALRCSGASITYAGLAEQVGRAAAAYRALGVAPGERVLFLLRDTPEYAAAWLGAVHAGAVAIGLNTRLSEAEYRYVCADSGVRISLVEDRFVQARPDLAAEFAQRGILAVAGEDAPPGSCSWRALLSRATPVQVAQTAEPHDPAFWLYSSGTTGKPKGIVHSHQAVLSAGQVFDETLALAPGDKVFVTSKLFFAYALDHGFLGALAHGLTTVLHADWPEIDEVCEIVAQERPAVFASVPSFYRRL